MSEALITSVVLFGLTFFILFVGTLWIFDETKKFVKFAYAFVPLFRVCVIITVLALIGVMCGK